MPIILIMLAQYLGSPSPFIQDHLKNHMCVPGVDESEGLCVCIYKD